MAFEFLEPRSSLPPIPAWVSLTPAQVIKSWQNKPGCWNTERAVVVFVFDTQDRIWANWHSNPTECQKYTPRERFPFQTWVTLAPGEVWTEARMAECLDDLREQYYRERARQQRTRRS